MQKLLKLFDKCLEWVIFICAITFVVLCFLQVLMRYVFNNSIPWSEEASRFLFVVVVFLGGIICVKEKRHTNIDILYNLLPAKNKRYYMFGIYFLMFVFGLFLMYSGWILAVKNIYQKSSALQIPLGYLYMVIPFSGLFMAVNSIRVAIDDFRNSGKTGKDKGEENK